MKKKTVIDENYLEKIPLRNEKFRWTEKDGKVTIEIDNKGVFNRIFQVLLKKPKVTYIHLDEMGSFIWPLLSEDLNIIAIGQLVLEHFGEKANPLYERLAKFFQILEGHKFIVFKE